MKKNLGFVIIMLVMILASGCGKDDKSVTSVIAPSYYLFGTSDPKYLNAIPRNLNVSKSGANNAIVWDAPTMTTNLIGYRVYMSTRAPQGNLVYENGSSDLDILDTAADGWAYSYTVTSVFYVLDTTYNFYTEIESYPSYPGIVDRP